MPVEAVPAPPLEVAKPALALGVLIELLYGPARVRQLAQPLQGSVGPEHGEVILPLAFFSARWRPLGDQPAFGGGYDVLVGVAVIARRAYAPVRSYGDHLLAEGSLRAFSPAYDLPVPLGYGIDHFCRGVQRSGARLRGLPHAPVFRRPVGL